MTQTLPVGYRSRPALESDALAVYEIMAANALQFSDQPDESLEDVKNEFESPHINLARNGLVVTRPDGAVVGSAILYDVGRLQAPYIDAYLHPDEQRANTSIMGYLIHWLETRVCENLAVVPAEHRIVMLAYSVHLDNWYNAHLQAAGFSLIRHSYEMSISLNETPATPIWPEGLTLRYVTADEDWRPILEALRDAWRDHWGYIESPFDEHFARWEHHWRQVFKPGLLLLGMDGDRVAGMALNQPDVGGNQDCGYVGTLCVRRDYRRRGLAMALLQQSFLDFHAMGKTEVTLGVDASSLTGATRLYERAGMHVKTQYDLYEKELRAGIEIRTETAGM